MHSHIIDIVLHDMHTLNTLMSDDMLNSLSILVMLDTSSCDVSISPRDLDEDVSGSILLGLTIEWVHDILNNATNI